MLKLKYLLLYHTPITTVCKQPTPEPVPPPQELVPEPEPVPEEPKEVACTQCCVVFDPKHYVPLLLHLSFIMLFGLISFIIL